MSDFEKKFVLSYTVAMYINGMRMTCVKMPLINRKKIDF